MKKLLSILISLVLLCTMIPALAEDSDLAYIQNKGKLIVGITDYAPMDYLEDGEWTGFDAEFAREFAKDLGVEIEFFVLSDWGMKFFELDTKNIDVIWNGMTISEDVLNNTSCSNPYVVNAQVVVMKQDALANYPDVESLKSLNFAVESGSVGEDALKGIGITEYVALQDQTAALMEVAAGTADACVIDITMANAMTGENTSYADLGVGLALTSEEYGVGFRKGSDLVEKFNDFMQVQRNSGWLQQLADKYQLTLAEVK
ncbi:MAG: transporter substrate-binding domain-containing protein [Clostridia bacterium]|nr:transporter substrate-binding domain-containing protein [Clostridia bacterium]